MSEFEANVKNTIIELIELDDFSQISILCKNNLFKSIYQSMESSIEESYGDYIVKEINDLLKKQEKEYSIYKEKNKVFKEEQVITDLSIIKKEILRNNNVSEYALSLKRFRTKEVIKEFLKEVLAEIKLNYAFFNLKKSFPEYASLFDEKCANSKEEEYKECILDQFESTTNLHGLEDSKYLIKCNEDLFYQALNNINITNDISMWKNSIVIRKENKNSLYKINKNLKYQFIDEKLELLNLNQNKASTFLNNYINTVISETNKIIYNERIHKEVISKRSYFDTNPVIIFVKKINIKNETIEIEEYFEKKGFLVLGNIYKSNNKKQLSTYFLTSEIEKIDFYYAHRTYNNYLLEDNTSLEFWMELKGINFNSKFKEKEIDVSNVLLNNKDKIKDFIKEDGYIVNDWKSKIISLHLKSLYSELIDEESL